MEELDLNGVKPYLEKLTLGVTRLLENSPGVTEVMFVEKEPAERHTIISWEQKNACVLPEDLKNFYLMTDGFRMTWSVKFDDNPVSLGCMTINSISKLNRLGVSPAYALPSAPTLADLEDTDEEEGDKEQPKRPYLDSRCLIFELDPCAGNGKVCLVYKNTKPVVSPESEIWFLDRALYWHFLTKSFTAYYRLLITHLGLPQWQYTFTSYGISPQAKVRAAASGSLFLLLDGPASLPFGGEAEALQKSSSRANDCSRMENEVPTCPLCFLFKGSLIPAQQLKGDELPVIPGVPSSQVSEHLAAPTFPNTWSESRFPFLFSSNGSTCTNPSRSTRSSSQRQLICLSTSWTQIRFFAAKPKCPWSRRGHRPNWPPPRRARRQEGPPGTLRRAGACQEGVKPSLDLPLGPQELPGLSAPYRSSCFGGL
ncbi:tubulin polyglutamylase complex subunit 2 isoform 1-T1 [Liasis olivaceus]